MYIGENSLHDIKEIKIGKTRKSLNGYVRTIQIVALAGETEVQLDFVLFGNLPRNLEPNFE